MAGSANYERLTYHQGPVLLEQLSAALHAVYQDEARRQASFEADSVRHPEDYRDLAEHTKDYDRALALWILRTLQPEPGWLARYLTESGFYPDLFAEPADVG